jgi:hypothetical protein
MPHVSQATHLKVDKFMDAPQLRSFALLSSLGEHVAAQAIALVCVHRKKHNVHLTLIIRDSSPRLYVLSGSSSKL